MRAKAILALIVCGEIFLPFRGLAQTQNRVELRPPPPSQPFPIQRRARAHCSPRPRRSLCIRVARTAILPPIVPCRVTTSIYTSRQLSEARTGPGSLAIIAQSATPIATTICTKALPTGAFRDTPRWQFAPIEMAWEGKPIGDICRQLKDPSRNGGRDLALPQEHVAKDNLIAWGWSPGTGRDPAPGTQEGAGQLVQAGIDTGAQCP
jgi:hypothetical protein